MKIFAAAAAAMVLVATPARAADVLDLSTITCAQFVSSGEDTIGNLLMWLQGYYTEDGDPTVLDKNKMEQIGGKLGGYCAANPDMGLLTAAEEVMGKDE